VTDEPDRPAVGWPWRAFAFAIVALRYPILLAWIAAAVAATALLPALAAAGNIGNLIPAGAPAVRAEYDAAPSSGCRSARRSTWSSGIRAGSACKPRSGPGAGRWRWTRAG
jgi:hypothetical protein